MKAALLAALVLGTGSPQPSDFRWTRTLNAAPGAGPIAFDADAPLFAHAGRAFAGLRIVDADGAEVPWRRPYPLGRPASAPRRVFALNRGRSGGAAVALLDLGRRRVVRTRVELEIPDREFIGTATVWGSDDRRRFTRLGSSRVFALVGAEGRASSTAVTFPPSDFRYLRLLVTGVTSIRTALLSAPRDVTAPRPIAGRVHGRVIDLGGANVPVDALLISSSTPRYIRPVRVEARNPGEPWRQVGDGRVFRLYGTASPPLLLFRGEARYLRVTILNGDDPPLAGVRLQPLAIPETILVEGGHPEPLRLLYGGRPRPGPRYEFARLPADLLGLEHVRRATIGKPVRNSAFEPAADTRSWARRHPVVVDAALALAAAVVGLAGFLALRRRA